MLISQGGSFRASDSWLSVWKRRHKLDLWQSNSSAVNFVDSEKFSAFSFVTHEKVDVEDYLITIGEPSWNII